MNLPPLPPRDDRTDGERGFVSLRDYLAAAALTGLLSSHGIHGSDYSPEKAYQIADAMLAARKASQ